jgi:hypothetical protein
MQLTDSTKNGSSVMATTAATPEYQRLEIFIGEWIDEGEVIATPDTPPVKILTSDVYEWLPGRFFVAPHRIRTDRRHGSATRRSSATTPPVSSIERTSSTATAPPRPRR